jgi:hypothetical protein
MPFVRLLPGPDTWPISGLRTHESLGTKSVLFSTSQKNM